MGSQIEINDTLQITAEQGFPVEILNLERHERNPIALEELKEKVFTFHSKPGKRIFHLDPCRAFLVQNIDGKWLFWGHVLIQRLEIKKAPGGIPGTESEWETSGTYRVSQLYDPEFQRIQTKRESPSGKSFFK